MRRAERVERAGRASPSRTRRAAAHLAPAPTAKHPAPAPRHGLRLHHDPERVAVARTREPAKPTPPPAQELAASPARVDLPPGAVPLGSVVGWVALDALDPRRSADAGPAPVHVGLVLQRAPLEEARADRVARLLHAARFGADPFTPSALEVEDRQERLREAEALLAPELRGDPGRGDLARALAGLREHLAAEALAAAHFVGLDRDRDRDRVRGASLTTELQLARIESILASLDPISRYVTAATRLQAPALDALCDGVFTSIRDSGAVGLVDRFGRSTLPRFGLFASIVYLRALLNGYKALAEVSAPGDFTRRRGTRLAAPSQFFLEVVRIGEITGALATGIAATVMLAEGRRDKALAVVAHFTRFARAMVWIGSGLQFVAGVIGLAASLAGRAHEDRRQHLVSLALGGTGLLAPLSRLPVAIADAAEYTANVGYKRAHSLFARLKGVKSIKSLGTWSKGKAGISTLWAVYVFALFDIGRAGATAIEREGVAAHYEAAMAAIERDADGLAALATTLRRTFRDRRGAAGVAARLLDQSATDLGALLSARLAAIRADVLARFGPGAPVHLPELAAALAPPPLRGATSPEVALAITLGYLDGLRRAFRAAGDLYVADLHRVDARAGVADLRWLWGDLHADLQPAVARP